jgi:outer membrane protein assembly factor BamC
MNSYRFLGALVLAALTALGGCNSNPLTEDKKIDYKSAGKLPTLEIPPDLTPLSADGRFAVPDVSPQASATYSEYSKERVTKAQAGPAELLPASEKVRIERAGSQRWLVVNAPPEQVWPVIKEFWNKLGFTIKTELPEAGIIETDWAENRAKIPQDPIRNVLSKVVDSLYSTSERDKFRTRLEPGKDKGTTEIYISHRGMYEVVTDGAAGASQTVWQPRPADPELEAEMLRRLMVQFGVDEARATTLIAANVPQERAKVSHDKDGAAILALADPFDRAWRRVGLALDRVGFTVEDRDRSKGLYYVRYVDPEADDKKSDQGILSKLAFWRSNSADNKKTVQYRIEVAENAGGSQVRVLAQDGSSAAPATGNKIVNLLYEQLK